MKVILEIPYKCPHTNSYEHCYYCKLNEICKEGKKVLKNAV